MSSERSPLIGIEQSSSGSPNRINNSLRILKTRLGRLASIGLVISSGAFATVTLGEVVRPAVARADALGYPWPTDRDAPCQFGEAGGSACANPNDPSDKYDWGVYIDKAFHPYRNGYEYRNCTDYVQWKESTVGVAVPSNWGNGGQWYNNAPTNMQSSTPKAWDAAVVPSASASDPGHVAFIESVDSIDPNNSLNDVITVSEYNHDTQGHGDIRKGKASSMGFTKFIDFGAHPKTEISGSGPGPDFMPAMVQRPSGETDVAAVGPNNSLVFYYNSQGSGNWGKMVIPGAQAFSTPNMIQRSPSGETDIAVQGPSNSLDFYFNAQGSPNWGKSAVAVPGWVFSAPDMVQRSSGETDIAVQGPSHSLDYYFNDQGSPYWRKIQVARADTTYSAPKMIQRASGETDIVAQGPDNSLIYYFNAQGSPNWGKLVVAGSGSAYSAPEIVQRPDSGETDIAVQGPNNSLAFYINQLGSIAWSKLIAAGVNTTHNSPNPPSMLQRPGGETDIAIQGPGNQADFYFNAPGSPTWGESIVAVNSYAFRAPVMLQRPGGESDIVVVGPNNRLDYYYNQQGSPYWAYIPIAGDHSAS
jgi:surface antigen